MRGVKNLIYIIFFLLVVSVSFCAQQFPTVWIRPPYYTKTEADERFVNVEGDIMQGNLDMNLFNITNVKYLSVQTISSTTVSGDLDVTNTFRVGGGFGSGGLTIYPNGTIMTNGDIVFSGDISTVNVTNYNITGNMTPSLDAEYTIGNATRRWKEIWFYDKIYDYNTTFFIDLNDPIQSLYAAGALYQRGGQLVIDVDNIVNYAVTSLNGFVGSVDILGNSPITVSSSNNQITIGLQYDSNTLDVGANGLYVIDKYVDITGDTMQGILNMGGYRIVNLGEPIDDSDATTKYYVDTLISGLEITYFFTNESSGVNTYYIMDPTRRVQATLVFGPFSTGTGQFVVGFITHNTTIPKILHKGVHLAHILAYKDGTKPVYIYWKLYERLSNGTEILIMTSETSVELTTERQPFDLPAVLDDDYILSDGSELVLKIFADVEQTGSDVYIYIDTGNESNSYFSVKVPSIEFKQIFVPYEGAVKNVSLGNYSLSASELTASKINVESGSTNYSFYISGSNLKLDYGTSNIFYYDTNLASLTVSKKLTMKNALDLFVNPIVNVKYMHISSFTSPPCSGPGCLWVLQNPDDPAADFLVWAYKSGDHRHIFLTPAAENLNMSDLNITDVNSINIGDILLRTGIATNYLAIRLPDDSGFANVQASIGAFYSHVWSPALKYGGDINIMTTSGSNGNLIFSTNGTEVMRITESGNVGIGTTSPSYKLHIITPGSGTTGLMIEAPDSYGSWLSFKNTDRRWDIGIDSSEKFRIADHTGNTYPLIIEPGTPTNTLYLDSSGNIGIGTNSPSYELDVSGSIHSTGTIYANSIVHDDRIFTVGNENNLLGVSFLSPNPFGFASVYKVEYYNATAGTWVDITNDYNWQYLTDLKATEIAVNEFEANSDNTYRFWIDTGTSYRFITYIVMFARHIYYLKSVKVESSSYSDFSSDVNTRLDWSGSVWHWDQISLWRLSSHTADDRYVRITITVNVGTSAPKFREFMAISKGDIYSVMEGYLPFDWDYNKNVFLSGSLGVGTASPSYTLDVNGTLGTSGNIYPGGSIIFPDDLPAAIKFPSSTQGFHIENLNGKFRIVRTGVDYAISINGTDKLLGIWNDKPEFTVDISGETAVRGNLIFPVANSRIEAKQNFTIRLDRDYEGDYYFIITRSDLMPIFTVSEAGVVEASKLTDINDNTYYVDPSASPSAILAGKVGIQTTSPNGVLHVYEPSGGTTIEVESASGYWPEIVFAIAGTNKGLIGVSSNSPNLFYIKTWDGSDWIENAYFDYTGGSHFNRINGLNPNWIGMSINKGNDAVLPRVWLGPSTSVTITAFEDNTYVFVNGDYKATLNAGESTTITLNNGDILTCSRPCSAGGGDPFIVPVPISWAGYNFATFVDRKDPQYLYIYAPFSHANCKIYNGTTLATTLSIDKGTAISYSGNFDNDWPMYIECDAPVLVFKKANGADAIPLYPCSYELYGSPSGSARVVALEDDTHYIYFTTTGGVYTGTLNRGDSLSISGASQYTGPGVKIIADKPICARSEADADGSEQTVWTAKEAFGNVFILPRSAEFIKAVSDKPFTIRVYNSTSLKCENSSVGTSFVQEARIYYSDCGSLDAGDIIITSELVWLIYEDKSTNDETILIGYNYETVPGQIIENPVATPGDLMVGGQLIILTTGTAPLYLETDDTGGQLYTTFWTGRGGGAYDFKFGSGAGTWKAARITPARGGTSSSKGAGMLQLFDADSEKVRISASGDSYFLGGNVGIGTSSPSAALDVSGDIKASGTVYGNGEPYAKGSFVLLPDAESDYHSYTYGGPNPVECTTVTIKGRYFPAGELAKSTKCVFLYGVNGYYDGVDGTLTVKVVTPDGTTYSGPNIGLSTSAKNYWGEISIDSSDCTNGYYKMQLTLCAYYDDVTGQGSTVYGKGLTGYLIVR